MSDSESDPHVGYCEKIDIDATVEDLNCNSCIQQTCGSTMYQSIHTSQVYKFQY